MYRATEHGFTRKAFAKRCNERGATLTVIKSEHGNVFGGFTSLAWNTPEGDPSSWCYNPDPKAFLFSLTHRTKHEQIKNHEYAVRHSPEGNILMWVFGSSNNFGVGCDVVIIEHCNHKRGSYSDLGATYEPPLGV